MIAAWESRTQLLLGDEQINTLHNAHVLLVGLGGIGGIVGELLARTGIGTFTLVDADLVEASNRNRQVPALANTEGQPKVKILAERMRAINPNVVIFEKQLFLTPENVTEIVNQPFTCAIDAIDTLTPKIFYIKTCVDLNIPIISAMGAGGKLNPSLVQLADLSETHTCNLARYVRKKLHQFHIYTGVKVVFSTEVIDKSKVQTLAKASPKKSIIGTISYIPTIFGCYVAAAAIEKILQNGK